MPPRSRGSGVRNGGEAPHDRLDHPPLGRSVVRPGEDDHRRAREEQHTGHTRQPERQHHVGPDPPRERHGFEHGWGQDRHEDSADQQHGREGHFLRPFRSPPRRNASCSVSETVPAKCSRTAAESLLLSSNSRSACDVASSRERTGK